MKQEIFLQRIIFKLRKYFTLFVKAYVWFKSLGFFHAGSSYKDALDNLRENFPDAPEGWIAKIAAAGKVTWIGADLKNDGRVLSDFHYTRTVNKGNIYNPDEKSTKLFGTKRPSKGSYKNRVVHGGNTKYLKKTVSSQTEEKRVPRLRNPLAVSETARTEKAAKAIPCSGELTRAKRYLEIDSAKIVQLKDKPENVQHEYNPLVYNRTNHYKSPSFNKDVKKESSTKNSVFILNVKKQSGIVNDEKGFIKGKKITSAMWPSLNDKAESLFSELNLSKEKSWKRTEAEKRIEMIPQKEEIPKLRFPELLDNDLDPGSQLVVDRWPSLPAADNISETDFKDGIREEKGNVWNE